MEVSNDYHLFLDFIYTYLPDGFQRINNDDPLMRKISALERQSKQFFYLADMLQMKVLFISPSVKESLGIDPYQFDPGHLLRITHPDDQTTHSISRARMIQLCNDIYIRGQKKHALMSTSLRFQHADEHYINFIIQGYVFLAMKPVPTTYALFINTDISWFGHIKNGYNYYIGEDMSYFRIPDKDQILTGCIFTDLELEIIKLIREGLDSQEIGKKLLIITHTVDTHRSNILKKTGKISISALIIDLQEKGFF